MVRRILFAAVLAFAMTAALAPFAQAGEVTGNGKSLHVENSKWGTGLHARSLCAYSGQEDLQFEGGGSKGVPGHAQSWGRIPKAVRDTFPAEMHPGMACNPMRTTLAE
jgi:hypothetical protein